MMKVRGMRPVLPTKGKAPTGILSTNGKQKVDSTDHFQYQGTMKYAHGTSPRSKPSGNGKKNLRSQGKNGGK